MSTAEELRKLTQLFEDGTITEEQYDRARAKLLAGDDYEDAAEGERRPRRRRDRYDEDDRPMSPRERRKKAREWCMAVHLALLAGHVVPFGGIAAPILIWQLKKEEFPEVDEHGKNAVNWLLSFLIYAAISGVLCFVLVGFVLLPIVLVLNIVFPVIAGVKANEGEVWSYPMAIRFLK